MPGVQKEILIQGNKSDYPKKGDEVTVNYTGWFYDANQASNRYRGRQFDSSATRGAFKTKIGIGKVIPGWDLEVPRMSLGEKSVLTIPGNMAYGSHGFPGLIPPNSTLVFEIDLLGINEKRVTRN